MENSLARQNFTTEAENFLNDQINLKFQAAHTYASMAAYFDRDDVALPGLREYHTENYKQERDQAFKLIEYQNRRGGRVELKAIQAPEVNFSSAKVTIDIAMDLHRGINDSLIKLTNFAIAKSDAHLSHIIKDEFLPVRVKAIKELADYKTQLNLVLGEGIGLFLWDRSLLRDRKAMASSIV